jgi:CO/xanthine dehydrogenase Mo-binding subunit
VRVAQPYIGGGFGMKAGLYSEDILIPFAAMKLGRPVKWLEDKREQFQSSNHSREQHFDAEVAVDAEGKLLGLRYSVIIDVGAYLTFPVVLPYLGMCHVFGPYKLPALDVRFKSVFTNKVTSAPYRGAGRPEVVFMVNRLIDRIGRELGIDAAEVRRRNFIRPDEMPFDAGIPYRDGSPMILDSGDYPGALERNLEAIGYEGFCADQARAREDGRYIGIGMCCNIEAGGLGPVELARIEITPKGDVVLHLGVVDTGQGQRTVFAQICADALGIDIERVSVRVGDSAGIAYSRGTYHSRTAVTAGNAVLVAAQRVEAKLKVLAGHHLETSPEDLELVDGVVRVKGAPDLSISLERCAQLGVPDGSSVAGATATAGAILGLPPDMSPGIDETGHFVAKSVVWGNASHAAIVEVDPELGTFKILRYVVVHDCGRVLNPMLVDGQIHGGVAQGIGGAVLEHLVYDDNGQLATSTMADYMIPRAADIPEIEIIQMESPSPLNPLGVKGAGEGGTIGPPAALAAAVEDALATFGARITETPLSPAVILKALREAKARKG